MDATVDEEVDQATQRGFIYAFISGQRSEHGDEDPLQSRGLHPRMLAPLVDWQELALQPFPDELLDWWELVRVPFADEHHGSPRAARPRRATNAVDVRLRVLGDVVV